MAPFGYDLVVFDGVSPGSTLTSNTVVINAIRNEAGAGA